MDDCCYDNGGRRCGWERREFFYTGCLPERRSPVERRSGTDRRKMMREPDADKGRQNK